MNKIISILLLVFTANIVSAQCGVNADEIQNKYCEGKFLKSREFREDTEFTYVLSSETSYFVYLLNAQGKVPDFEINLMRPNGEVYDIEKLNKNEKPPFYSYESKIDFVENYKVFRFKTNKTGIYKLKIDFDEDDENPCILWAMYFNRD